jgi:hypothetical protein
MSVKKDPKDRKKGIAAKGTKSAKKTVGAKNSVRQTVWLLSWLVRAGFELPNPFALFVPFCG